MVLLTDYENMQLLDDFFFKLNFLNFLSHFMFVNKQLFPNFAFV